MDRQVIVNSFHSQVPRTLSKLYNKPDIIVAIDAHLDVFMGVKDILNLMPKQIQLAATRASAHFAIRRVFGEIPAMLKAEGLPVDLHPEMILVVPQISMNRHVFEQAEKIRDIILSGALSADQVGNQMTLLLDYLSKFLGIQAYTSPPKNLMKLVDRLRKADYPLIDLDVDYMQELQTECYTPVESAPLGQLGWTEQVHKLIRKTKPPIVTVSEAKVAAIRGQQSNFSRFIGGLKSLGYKVRYGNIFPSDEEAMRLIQIYRDFYEGVQKPLEKQQHEESDYLDKEAFERHHNQLKEATRRYFSRKMI